MRDTAQMASRWALARLRTVRFPARTVLGAAVALGAATGAVAYFAVLDDGPNSLETVVGPPVTAAALEDPGRPALGRPLGDDPTGPRELLRVQPDPSPAVAPTSPSPPTSPSTSPSTSSWSSPPTSRLTPPPTSSLTSPPTSSLTSPPTSPSTSSPPTSASSGSQEPTGTTTSADGGDRTPCRGNERFERVFRDDFNGDSVGPGWRLYDSVGNNGYGLRRPSAIAVADGNLVITAEMIDGQLVSGGMAHNYDQTYGKYVVKVRTGHDPSVTVSGVVLTWPQSQVHPRDGENNIYETLVYDADRSPFYSVIHKPFGTKSDQELKIHSADGTTFQIMTMEWTPEGITITREGPGAVPVERWTVAETAEDLIPDVAHHVTIQLDAWKHSIPGSVRMEVDFIEVHRYCG